MADITNEIAAIQVATTGSAIRTALVDALEAINTEQSWTADDVPTEGSNNLVKSGGIYQALEDVKNKVYISDVTLSTSWLGDDPYYQEVTIDGATELSKIDLQPDNTVFQQLISDGVLSLWIENNEGSLTAYAIGAAPTASLVVQCTITDVDPNYEPQPVPYYSGPYTVTPSTVSQELSVSGYQMSSNLTIEAFPAASVYSDSYVITPSTVSQELSVSGYQMSSNLVIEAFPQAVLTSKTISENGIYYASDDSADGYSMVTVSVAGGGSNDLFQLIDRTITSVNDSEGLVSSIASYAFFGCSTLLEVSFPSCKDVGSQAFRECTNLSFISFPELISIYDYAFYACHSLLGLELSKTQYIKSHAFGYCINLSVISLSYCRKIFSYAFEYCSALTSIYLLAPFICTLENSNAFRGDYSLTDIYVPSSLYNGYIVTDQWSYFANKIFSM